MKQGRDGFLSVASFTGSKVFYTAGNRSRLIASHHPGIKKAPVKGLLNILI
jgi:hypothetical protein